MYTIKSGAKPSAHIAVKRNRLKHYGTNVYLKDKTSFEIELNNPTQSKILAKIEMNGKLISNSGIVLRPGERVFLERWIDENRQFLFETYEVQNSKNNKEAVEQNGEITILFYDETVIVNYNPPTYFGGSFGTTGDNTFYCSTTNNKIGASTLTSSSYNVTNDSHSGVPCSDSLETGRAEKGEDSKQELAYESASFNNYTSSVVKLKIIPESLQQKTVSQIRNYCSNCGTRNKAASWSFCPKCGSKF